MRKKLYHCFAFTLIIALLLPNIAFAQDITPTLEFSVSDGFPSTIDKALSTVAKELGYSFNVSVEGIIQGVETTNSGEKDGFLGPQMDLASTYPNIVQVPEPIENISFGVFARENSNFNLNQFNEWDDLENQRVGTIYQRPYIDARVPQNMKKFIKKHNYFDLTQALLDNECDLAVYNLQEYDEMYLPTGVKFLGIIDRSPMFIYLNKSNSNLVPLIDGELKRMKSTGELQSILKGEKSRDKSEKAFLLHLTSRGYDSDWAIGIDSGLESAIDILNTDLRTISIQAKSGTIDKIRKNNYAKLIRSELLVRIPDAVIVSDEVALEFVAENYYTILPNIPIIICGVPDLDNVKIDGFQENFTGISQELSVEDTVNMMLHLFPKTKHIFVVNDDSRDGVSSKSEIVRKSAMFTDKITFEYSTGKTHDDIVSEINALPPNTAVLVGKFESEVKSQNISAPIIKDSVPIFGLFATDQVFKQIGGKYVDSFEYGKYIASSLKSKGNADLGHIVTDTDGLNTWQFDYNVLTRFSISTTSLPQESVIKNMPPAPRKLRIDEVVSFAIFALALISATVFLVIFFRRLIAKTRILNETQKKLHTAEEMLQKDLEIAETRQRLEKTLDSAPVSFVVSSGKKILRYNKMAGEIFDLENVDSALSLYAHSQDIDEVADMLRENGYVYGEIIRFIVKGGDIHSFHSNFSKVEAGERSELYAWVIDIENLEGRKRLVDKSNQDLLNLLNSMPLALAMLLPTRERIFANEAYIKMFKFNNYEEAISCEPSKVCPEFQSQGVTSDECGRIAIFSAFESSETQIFPFQYVNMENKQFETTVYMRGIIFHGQETALIAIRDMSEEKEKAEQLVQIAESEKAANLLKSKFLINMSHEIRTPMNAIIGLAEIELRKASHKETLDVLKKINQSAKNLLTIIGDILDFSKIEAEELVLVEQEMDLEEVISNVLLMTNQRIGSKSINLVFNMDNRLPSKLLSDSTRLWQVLKNLLDNSAKYTENGRIQLDVSLEDGSEQNKKIICFKITDTGYGMTEEQLAKLFTPFEQFHMNKQEGQPGTGLGMAITHQILALMGGTIDVQSKKDEGTSIKLSIPFKVPSETKSIYETLTSLPLEGHRVLVADDDPFTIEIIKGLLEAAGIQPVCVSSGEDALKVYEEYLRKQTPFDIVILDYIMEGMNGIETAIKLREVSEEKLAKLLMVSSYTKQLIMSEIEKAGYEDVIEKPFTPSDFMHRLVEIADSNIKFNSFDNVIFPRAKVLLCEDNIINQEVAAGILEYFDIVPIIANNGVEALELLKEQKFDLIFMDIIMPEMDGHEATKAIRSSNESYKDVPIVAMTANVMSEEVEKCVQGGMNGHIGKPVNFERVFVKLMEWLSSYAEEKKEVVKKDMPKGIEGLRCVDDIDVDGGLRRFMGKEEKYTKLLKSFCNSIGDYIIPIEDASKPENAEKMRTTVHTLKGVAGNLGLKAIYSEALKYESITTIEQYELLAKLAEQQTQQILSILNVE